MDRFNYVRNNPVRYIDPSGNVVCPPGVCDEDPEEYIDYEVLIERRFDNVNIWNGFNNEQLRFIYQGLKMILNVFENNMGAFNKALGQLNFVKIPKEGFGMAPPLSNLVLLGQNIFNASDENDILMDILHEVGHRFDFEGALGIATKYKSEFFVQTFDNDKSCMRGFLGCLGPEPPPIYAIGFSPIKQYNVSLDASDWGRKAGSIEDFADSFASFVMLENNKPLPPNKGTSNQDRLYIIGVWISIYK
jgi:hypothetical protein